MADLSLRWRIGDFEKWGIEFEMRGFDTLLRLWQISSSTDMLKIENSATCKTLFP